MVKPNPTPADFESMGLVMMRSFLWLPHGSRAYDMLAKWCRSNRPDLLPFEAFYEGVIHWRLDVGAKMTTQFPGCPPKSLIEDAVSDIKILRTYQDRLQGPLVIMVQSYIDEHPFSEWPASRATAVLMYCLDGHHRLPKEYRRLLNYLNQVLPSPLKPLGLVQPENPVAPDHTYGALALGGLATAAVAAAAYTVYSHATDGRLKKTTRSRPRR